MSVIEKIKNRKSNAFIDDRDVPQELIEQLLDVAVCTPVHYCTDPWRFLVIRGKGRERFGQYMANYMKKGMDDPDSASNQKKLEIIAGKPMRAPVIIAVAAAKSDDPRVLMVEDIASANLACYNILLAAEELGLAAIWRSGTMTYDDDMVRDLGFEEGSALTGFIYLGYPCRGRGHVERAKGEPFTRWLDD